ncbi:MAG: hypothetical protein JWM11_3770 [Planctomycetaceae bacterium]|nr:hypothetical protein [Planctomycetaceae bacterium]
MPRQTITVSEDRLRELRERSKKVREQVAADREQIAAEGREVIDQAIKSGRLVKFLFRPEEQDLLEAVDRFASEHNLNGREQVIRCALTKLLKDENRVS